MKVFSSNLSTREKIIKTAISLFNKNGFFNVSLRMISDEIGISVGNLTYHFHKKEDLVSEIIKRLITERNICNIQHYPMYLSLMDFHIFLEGLHSRHKNYRFLYDDLVDLTKKYTLFREYEIQATSELKFFYNFVLKSFITQGFMHNDEIFSNQYENIVDVMITVSSFYTQQKVIVKNFPSYPQNLITMIWSILVLNFTKKGIDMFKEEILAKISINKDNY